MRLGTGLSAIALIALAVGCDKKDQDSALEEGKVAVSKATDFASGAWKSACDQASKVSADSGKTAIESAKSQLEAVRDKMSAIKAPAGMDSLRLDSVKAEIERLGAALTVKNLKDQLDSRVKEAMKLKENAEKNYQDASNKLQQADAEYQDLQRKLAAAQAVYDGAVDKAKEAAKRIQSL